MENYKPRVAAWLDVAFETTRITNPASIHLDALLGHSIPDAEQIALACAVMRLLVGTNTERYLEYAPILNIALDDTEAFTILPAPETEAALLQQWRRVEPPSFFIVKRQWRLSLRRIERYVCPLEFDLFPEGDGIYTRYSTSRSLSARREKQEYGRWIEAEYCPPELQLP